VPTSPAITLEVGNSTTLVARPNSVVSNPGDPLGTITWASDTPGVATAVTTAGTTSGQAVTITAISVGTATVTGTSTNGQTESVAVSVIANDSNPQGFTIIAEDAPEGDELS
jgi:uncharacterized protein YjdB